MTRPALSALFVLALVPMGSARAADTLSVPLFSDRSEELWPIEVGMQVVDVESGKIVIEEQPLVVRDGQATTFAGVVSTPQGERAFEVDLSVRHHALGAVELEYELDVHEAVFASLTWSDYLLHRLALGPRPGLGPQTLAAARADIVETDTGTHPEIVEVGGHRYEIRLRARSLRG